MNEFTNDTKWYDAWNGFTKGNWCNNIDVSNFIKLNYREYLGDQSFLSGPTEKSKKVWGKCENLLKEELKNTCLRYRHRAYVGN